MKHFSKGFVVQVAHFSRQQQAFNMNTRHHVAVFVVVLTDSSK
jgi:hypothetical protein